jgi:hypothetical protein
MDCGQGKINNNGNNGPTTAWGLDEGISDVAIGQDGGQVGRGRSGVEDAMGDTVSDVPIAIDGVKYPIAGAPHPINKLARLRKCESIPPPHARRRGSKSKMGGTMPKMVSGGTHGGRKGVQKQSAARSNLPNSH